MFGCMSVCVCWFGSGNNIGAEGGVSLGKALETSPTLKRLYLTSEYDMSVLCVLCVWIGRFVWFGVLLGVFFVALGFGRFVCVCV